MPTQLTSQQSGTGSSECDHAGSIAPSGESSWRSLTVFTAAILISVCLTIGVTGVRDQLGPAGRQMWEYKVVHATTFVSVKLLLSDQRQACVGIEKEFNRLGADGWELSHEVDGIFIFKRPQ